MDRAIYNLILGLTRFLGWLPPSVLRLIGRTMGEVGFWVYRRYRTITRRNLRWAYGDELTEAQVQKIARSCYRHFGQFVLEVCWLMFVTPERLRRQVIIHGLANVRRAVAEGRGVILLASHYGHWELSGLVASLVLGEVLLVVNTQKLLLVDRLINRLRTRWGNTLTRINEGAAVGIYRRLKSNGVVGIMVDLNAHWREGVFVPFFGRRACTHQGMALIWNSTHSPALPFYSYFVQGRWHVVFGEPLRFDHYPDKTKTIEAVCRKTNAAIEAIIRRRPEQWHWPYHRWKTWPYHLWPRAKQERDGPIMAPY